MQTTSKGALAALSYLTIAGLLTVAVLQMRALNTRLSETGAHLRELQDKTGQLASNLERLAAVPAPSTIDADACQAGGRRHFERPNLLREKPPALPSNSSLAKGELRRPWTSGEPSSFNPFLSNSADLRDLIVTYAGSRLATRDKWGDTGVWYADTACRAELSDDGLEFTFYLRKGIQWHKPAGVDANRPKHKWLSGPHELTAQDFVFALDIIKNPSVENGFGKSVYQDLDSWKALDAHTLVLRWKKRNYSNIDASLGLSPLPEFIFAYDELGHRIPEEQLGTQFNQHWYNAKGYVGTGPLRLSNYVPGRSIHLERNSAFFGSPLGLAHVVYDIYSDANQTLLKLKSGELNFAALLPSQFRELVANVSGSHFTGVGPQGKLECAVVPDLSYFYIGWNADKPLLADRRVRTALSMALRRDELVKHVLSGLGESVSGPFLAESGYLSPGVSPIPFDLGRSSALLAESGWVDTDGDGLVDKVVGGKRVPFELSLLLFANDVEFAALGNIYKDDLLKVGVKLNIEPVEWALMQSKMDARAFDAFTGGWGLNVNSDPYPIWHSSQADIPKGSNRVGFRNEEVDTKLERLRTTFDEGERRKLFQQIHEVIHHEQPYTFLYRRKRPLCWNQTVQNVTFAKLRPQDDATPWFVTSP